MKKLIIIIMNEALSLICIPILAISKPDWLHTAACCTFLFCFKVSTLSQVSDPCENWDCDLLIRGNTEPWVVIPL